MEERKKKGTWIGDLLARIVFQTGTGLCALMLGILVPGFEVHAGEQGCQWGYQQEQKQEQHMQLSDEADNYLAVQCSKIMILQDLSKSLPCISRIFRFMQTEL